MYSLRFCCEIRFFKIIFEGLVKVFFIFSDLPQLFSHERRLFPVLRYLKLLWLGIGIWSDALGSLCQFQLKIMN